MDLKADVNNNPLIRPFIFQFVKYINKFFFQFKLDILHMFLR